MDRGLDALRARYREAARASSYARRSAGRHAAEVALVARALARLPRGLEILDVPAGTGRVGAFLAARGHRVVSADASPAMLTATGEAPRPVVADALRLPFAPASFDAVLCFRFLHHLAGPAPRARLLAECARVARRHVLVSIRHAVSAHALRRRFARLLRGLSTDPRATTVRRLAREAASHGLRLEAADAQAAFRRELWLLTFARTA